MALFAGPRILRSAFVVMLGISRILAGEAAPSEKISDFYSTSNSISRGSFRSVLRPAIDVSLSSRAAGIVETIHVPEGSRVTAGESIISLDSNREKAEVQQAEASLRGAKADMARAAAELERTKTLRKDDIYSEKQLLEATAQAEITRSHYEQVSAAVDLARVGLVDRDIVSPISGIFLKTNKQVGEAIDRYETVARIIDVTSLEMVVFCDARYFSLFKEGQKVDVRVLKSNEDQPTVSGTIFHVDPIIDPSSGTFRVKVKIQPSPEAVPGFPAVLIAPSDKQLNSISTPP